MQNDKLLSDVFRWLRFPLIVGVVFIHCIGKPVDITAVNFSGLTGMDGYHLLRIAFSNVLPRVCVPLFFFMSGYLFFTHLEKWDWHVYSDKLRKRAKTILVPYLLWITLAILYQCAIFLVKDGGWQTLTSFLEEKGYWHLYWDCYPLDPVKLSWTGMEVYSTTPYHYALWYLRDLMIVMVLSPCFYWLFKHLRIWGLLLLLVNYVSNIGAVVPELLPTPLLFFGAGAYFQMNKIDATQCFMPYKTVIYVVALLLAIVCVRFNSFYTYTGNLFFPFFVIFGCMAVFNLATSMVKDGRWRLFGKLSATSFFIYLAHNVAIAPITLAVIGKVTGTSNSILMSMGYLAAPFIVIGECLLVYVILKRFFPIVYGFLTGGR